MAAFKAGDTFLIIDPNSLKQHLHIVMCDPAGDPPAILVVPLNTLTYGTDTTVVLQPGDHPFVRRATSVSYDLMRSMQTELLVELERMNAGRSFDRTFERNEPVGRGLLDRILQGALKSELTPKGMLRELKSRLNLTD